MLSIKNQTFFRFTERLSFKKLKEEEDYEEFVDVDVFEADSPFYTPEEVYEQVYMKRFTRKRPIIPFSDYTPPSGGYRFRKRSKDTADVLSVTHYQNHKYDGLTGDQATTVAATKKQAQSSPRSQFSFFAAIEDTFEQVKFRETKEGMSKFRFPVAGTAKEEDADMKMYFDGEKYFYTGKA